MRGHGSCRHSETSLDRPRRNVPAMGQKSKAMDRLEYRDPASERERVLDLQCILASAGENTLSVHATGAAEVEASGSFVTRVEALADLKLSVVDPAALSKSARKRSTKFTSSTWEPRPLPRSVSWPSSLAVSNRWKRRVAKRKLFPARSSSSRSRVSSLSGSEVSLKARAELGRQQAVPRRSGLRGIQYTTRGPGSDLFLQRNDAPCQRSRPTQR